MKDFIGHYKNVFSKDYCDFAIKNFEILEKNGFTYSRKDADGRARYDIEDTSVCSAYLSEMEIGLNMHKEMAKSTNKIAERISATTATTLGGAIGREFNNLIWESVDKYVDEYEILGQTREFMSIHSNKMQKTTPGQGYHQWHFENQSKAVRHRELVYTVYLNDVKEGGETEFLYLSKRFTPKRGDVLIWPAGFTHTHRGNPPLSGDKFILTGWVDV